MGKHAFLIMAHNQPNLLRQLIKQIDDPRNDIYLHIDQKSDLDSIEFQNLPTFSQLTLIDPISVSWGGFSQIKCELALLKTATAKKSYAYYHLLSGVDLLLQDQATFHAFFDSLQGKELVNFQNNKIQANNLARVKYYYPFQEKIGNRKQLGWALQKGLVSLQKLFRIDRTKKSTLTFQKGANWFSITHDFARYILNQIPLIEDSFHATVCADELFVQTLLVNSPFANNLYHSAFDNSPAANSRLVFFEKNHPRTLTLADKSTLLHSNLMFARKFDDTIDANIIHEVLNKTQRKGETT